MSRIAEKFGQLLDTYRRPDGSRWGGQDLENATGGVVTRSYTSTLRKGNIENPGYDKLRAIAKAMGFPPELWFEDAPNGALRQKLEAGDKTTISQRLEHLFSTMSNEKTGTSYTNAEVARMSLGGISEKEIAEIRSGEIGSPTIDQILSLAEVFGIGPSYFTESKAPLLDRETIAALSDRSSTEILHRTLALSNGEKQMILDLLDHLGHLHNEEKSDSD